LGQQIGIDDFCHDGSSLFFCAEFPDTDDIVTAGQDQFPAYAIDGYGDFECEIRAEPDLVAVSGRDQIQIIETTDSRFVGEVLDLIPPRYGDEIRLGPDFAFEISVPIDRVGGELILACSNYVIRVRELGTEE
jgi:hypothetical protein